MVSPRNVDYILSVSAFSPKSR